MTRNELIDLLEKATGPDAKLDVEIWAALYAPDAFILRSPFNGEWCAFEEDNPKGHLVETRGKPKMRTPYTSSIDAALTLVPEGCQWTIEPDSAWVRRMGRDDVDEAQGFLIGRDGECTAIAICIAALKAQEASR